MELETEETSMSFASSTTCTSYKLLKKSLTPGCLTRKITKAFRHTTVVDAEGNFIRKDDRLLQAATGLSLFKPKNMFTVSEGFYSGACRTRAKRSPPTLRQPPSELKPSIIEVSHYADLGMSKRWPEIKGIPTITNGDAHDLDAILGLTTIRIGEVNLKASKINC